MLGVMVPQYFPVLGSTPKNPSPITPPPEHAGILSLIASYKALLTSSSMVEATSLQRKEGTLELALYTQPLGAITLTGLLNPSLAGSLGLVNAFTADLAADRVPTHSPFIGPRCSGPEPERSIVISLPLIVTVTLIRIGLSRSTPLLSI
ncbi:hypothetical protein ES708_15606 [subsurface metagenome]